MSEIKKIELIDWIGGNPAVLISYGGSLFDVIIGQDHPEFKTWLSHCDKRVLN